MSVLELIQDFWAAVYRQEHGLPEPRDIVAEKQTDLAL